MPLPRIFTPSARLRRFGERVIPDPIVRALWLGYAADVCALAAVLAFVCAANMVIFGLAPSQHVVLP